MQLCSYCEKPIGEALVEDMYCSIYCASHDSIEAQLHDIGSPPVARDVGPKHKDASWPKSPWNARPYQGPFEQLAPAVGGIKHDDGKLPLELLPLDAVEEIAKVLQFGAKKYAPNNWRGGFVYGRVFGALLRHLFSWWRGEDKDPETGLSPLAHAGCDVLFLLHFTLAKTGTDNRKENNT
jgi:hypothetical protein